MVGAAATYAALSAGLSGALVGSSLVPLFTFPAASAAATAAAATGFVPAWSAAATGATAGTATGTAVGTATTSSGAAAATGGAMAAAGVAFVVAVIIVAVTAAVLQGISVVDAASLPDKMASVVTDAPTSTVDVPGMLNDSSKAEGLYVRFISATLPSPSFQTCLSIVQVSLDADGLPAVSRPCLNPTPIPDRKSSDPWFAITAKGATTTSSAESITWKSSATQATAKTRLSGNWFISELSVPNQAPSTVQTLRIRYTDWDSNEQTVWLLGSASEGYKFVRLAALSASESLDPATCVADTKCGYNESIKYVGSDGGLYSASVVATPPPAAVTIAPTPVSVSVGGSYVNGAPRPLFTYTTSPAGVALTGTLTCTHVGEPNKYNLAIDAHLNLPGGYTLFGATCSGLSAPSGYSLAVYQGVPGGFVVSTPLPGQVEGARILQAGTPQIYLIDDTLSKRYIPDPPTYLNLFRDWNGIQEVADVSSIATGPAVTSGAYLAIAQETMQTVYLVDNGQKRGVTSPTVMDKFYFNWNQIRQVAQSTLDARPTGWPIN